MGILNLLRSNNTNWVVKFWVFCCFLCVRKSDPFKQTSFHATKLFLKKWYFVGQFHVFRHTVYPHPLFIPPFRKFFLLFFRTIFWSWGHTMAIGTLKNIFCKVSKRKKNFFENFWKRGYKFIPPFDKFSKSARTHFSTKSGKTNDFYGFLRCFWRVIRIQIFDFQP